MVAPMAEVRMAEAKAFNGQSLPLPLKRLPQRLAPCRQKLLYPRRHVRAYVQHATHDYRKQEILSLRQLQPRFLVWVLA